MPEIDLRPVRRYQVFLFALLSVVYMMPFVQGVVMSVVAKDVMRDLALTPDRMGVLGSAYLWVYAVSMVCSGMLAARFGPRRYLAGMYLLAGLGGLLFAFAPGFAVACLGRALAGMGTAAVLTSCLTLFGRWYRGESYSATCALFFSVGGLGAFLGAMPLAVATAAWGWRACMALVGGLTVLYALLVLVLVREWPPAGTEAALGLSPQPRDPVTPAVMWQAVRTVAKSGDFWRLACWFMGMSGFYLSFAALWAVPYLKDVHGLDGGRAGMVLSMFSFGFIVGNPALSWLAEKKLRSNRLGMGAAGAVALVLALVMFLSGTRLGYTGLLVLCLAMGMAVNGPNALVYSSARNLFGSRLANMASGALAGLCFLSGAVLQLLGGGVLAVAQTHGVATETAYLVAFAPFILCFLTAAYCGFTLSRHSDPGRISPMSWRSTTRIHAKGEETPPA